MKDLVVAAPENARVERIERFQSLQPGRYWRARKSLPGEHIEKGMVLLLQSLRYVDDLPHTVILRPHPSLIGKDLEFKVRSSDGSISHTWRSLSEHRFLVKEFLEYFEFEPDHEQVRAQEVRAIQGQIAELQNELLETQGNPQKLAGILEQKLKEETDAEQVKAKIAAKKGSRSSDKAPAPAALPSIIRGDQELVKIARGSLAQAIGSGITQELVDSLRSTASREHRIATLKAGWIKEKTAEIASTLQALTPFFEEQAAAALAQTEDVRAYVDQLMQGIGSLDLYVGKGVTVETIREGKGAEANVPLTLVQRKVLMDEELALFVDVDERFDFTNESVFFEALCKHEALVNQIFPTERCVLVMAVTRRDIDYQDPWTNAAKNHLNHRVFILVRNGENLFRVHSPVESHLGCARLFPSSDEQERIFQGFDGQQIKFENIAYTDKLSEHEQHALHYKRFLILICGLDHRLGLFGEFYPGPKSLEFVSLEFQAKYLLFLFDEGDRLLGEDRPSLKEWLKDKNAYLRAGSLVLCYWRELMTPESAPAACKGDYGRGGSYHISRSYMPEADCGVALVQREGKDLFVRVKVEGYSHNAGSDRSFNCKVSLSRFRPDFANSLAYLCLDAVRPEELTWYLSNHESRTDHIFYIRFFKRALRFLQAERTKESATRLVLLGALRSGNIAEGKEALELIDQAVIAWRAANGGAALPDSQNQNSKEWKALLDQMFAISQNGQHFQQEAAALAAKHGYTPLRLVLSGSAKYLLYAAAKADEQDNRLEPFAWVHQLTLDRGKKGFTVKARRWTLLPPVAAAETTLHEWPEAQEWAARKSSFASFEEKTAFFAETAGCAQRLSVFAKPLSLTRYNELFETWREVRRLANRKSARVVNPGFAVAFGAVRFKSSGKVDYLCVGSEQAHVLLHQWAPSEAQREMLRKEFKEIYQHTSAAEERFNAATVGNAGFSLLVAGPNLTKHSRTGFFDETHGQRGEVLEFEPDPDPRLNVWFEAWQAKRDENVEVWLAPEALDSKGRLMLDQLLGVELPPNYDPVNVFSVTRLAERGVEPKEPSSWFDIYRDDLEEVAHHLEEGAYSTCAYRAVNQAAALKQIHQLSALKLKQGAQLRSAKELPQAPQPSAGVERWFLVSQGMT